MTPRRGTAIALGGEAAGIGQVALNAQSLAAQPVLDRGHQQGVAGFAMVVAQYDIDPRLAVAGAKPCSRGWHGMRVDQPRGAELAVGLFDQQGEGAVIGPPAGLQAAFDLAGGGNAPVERLAPRRPPRGPARAARGPGGPQG